ncbi:glycosyl hydrolase [Planctomycetales bacterium]|nr:glycosyl hydrolase [Planctomycetales bacterium]
MPIPAGYAVAEPVSLIPEKGLDGWTTHYGKPLTQTRWRNEDGKLVLEPPGKDYDHANGDIVTAKQYTNFVLDFDWIASKGCNSGVKYRLKDFGAVGAKINWSKTFGILGAEYQVLDDPNSGEGKDPGGVHSAGGLYSVLGPDPKKKHLNPAGQVNHGRLIVAGNHVEHWLNGEKVLEYEAGSEQWKEAVSKSKFAAADGFGENPAGNLMLQDHGHKVTFTKLIIREIQESKK